MMVVGNVLMTSTSSHITSTPALQTLITLPEAEEPFLPSLHYFFFFNDTSK